MSWIKETLTLNGKEFESMEEVADWLNENHIGEAISFGENSMEFKYNGTGLWYNLDMSKFFELARYSILEIYQASHSFIKLDGDKPQKQKKYKNVSQLIQKCLKVIDESLPED